MQDYANITVVFQKFTDPWRQESLNDFHSGEIQKV